MTLFLGRRAYPNDLTSSKIRYVAYLRIVPGIFPTSHEQDQSQLFKHETMTSPTHPTGQMQNLLLVRQLLSPSSSNPSQLSYPALIN